MSRRLANSLSSSVIMWANVNATFMFCGVSVGQTGFPHNISQHKHLNVLSGLV